MADIGRGVIRVLKIQSVLPVYLAFINSICVQCMADV